MFKKIIFILLGIIVAIIVGFLAMGFLNPTHENSVSVTVNAPVSKSYSVFRNPDNMGKWMDNFKSFKNVSGGDNEVGSKWEIVFDENGRDLVMVETVTAIEHDKLFAFDVEDSFAKFHIEIKFEEVNGQTVITQNTTGAGESIAAKSMMAIMKGQINKQNEKMYNRLKTLIENS